MNARQLSKMGVPKDCMKAAIQTVQEIVKYNRSVGKTMRLNIKETLQDVVENPENFTSEEFFLGQLSLKGLANSIIEDNNFVRPDPCEYQTWGADGIDEGSHTQMQQACSMPVAFRGALMPDAHIGYGLPIGGVLALENAICPHAVGVDIACRMKVSIFDIEPWTLKKKKNLFIEALEKGTVFGVGQQHDQKQNHEVMDQDWSITKITRERKDVAWKQLGSSGSGNHFVEFGTITLSEDQDDLGLKKGEYVALMSHSGSRGAGANVCKTYENIARKQLPSKYEDLGRLAWLDMDSEEGQEYWAAMNLMGDYAAANHDVIHKLIGKLIGSKVIAGVENHHNFAWKEVHDGKEVYVHRKGATPASKGELGVIPGSMGTPAYIVRGLGNEASLRSASHGAGRLMSRTKAKDKYNFRAIQKNLASQGITILSAGADEVPGAYKDIEAVMKEQQDLVESIARFDPKIVMMDGSGSRAED